MLEHLSDAAIGIIGTLALLIGGAVFLGFIAALSGAASIIAVSIGAA
jgi:hypothetical protein